MKIIKETIVNLNEEWAAALRDANKGAKSAISQWLTNHKIDIEHTDAYKPAQLSSRDGVLHDDSALVILRIINGRGTPFHVALSNGTYIVDPELYGFGEIDGWKMASRVGIRKLLSLADDIVIYKQNAELANQMIDLQKQRKDAKMGTVNRVSPNDWKARRYRKIDKSGYELKPDKYKYMLAANNLAKYQTVIDNAFDIFEELQGKYRELRGKSLKSEIKFNDLNPWKTDAGSILSDISRYFYEYIDRFDRQYSDWQDYVKKYGEEHTDWNKGQVLNDLKKLKDLTMDMQKVKQAIDNGEFVDTVR